MYYLCGVRIHRARGYEGGSVSTKLGGAATSPPALVYCYSDILTFHFEAMHRLLGNACIFFAPKLYDTGITSKSSLRANRCEGTIRSEKVIQLAIGEANRKMLHDTRQCGGWRKRCGR